jgi:hypothetical protein
MNLDNLIKEKQAEMIVDLYEIRANVGSMLFDSRQPIPTHEVFQYNWLNTIIAKLTDKYGLSYRDIEEVIYKRQVAKKRKTTIQDIKFTNDPRFKL